MGSPITLASETARFWAKVDRRLSSGCFLWTAALNNMGYGLFRAAGKLQLAHRVSYEIANGPIPTGLLVCHSCDVPNCVNPDHLWVGTHKDNAADMVAKGRGKDNLGSQNGNSKLTELDVVAIRERLAVREPHSSIARYYGVLVTAISDISTGRNWSHIPVPDDLVFADKIVPNVGERNAMAKLTALDVHGIRGRLAAGEGHGSIAAAYGVSKGTIGRIKSGYSWSHLKEKSI